MQLSLLQQHTTHLDFCRDLTERIMDFLIEMEITERSVDFSKLLKQNEIWISWTERAMDYLIEIENSPDMR